MSQAQDAEDKASSESNAVEGSESKMAAAAKASAQKGESSESANFGEVDADIQAYIDASLDYVGALRDSPLAKEELTAKRAQKNAAHKALRAATEKHIKSLAKN